MGLRSTTTIQPQDLVISVPYSAMLSSDQAFKEFGNLVDASTISRSWMQVPVALKLISDRLQGASSAWKPYIDMLPKYLPHPIFFTPKDFGQLGGSPSYEDGMNLFYEMAAQYGLIYRELCRQWQAGTLEGYINPATFTFDAYRWGMALALTRSLKVSDDTGAAVTVLVPFWDLCNNGEEALYTKVDMKGTEEAKPGLYAYAMKRLDPDQEMFICYRETSTPNEYFTIWGLALVNYFSPISVKISAIDRNYAMKYHFLESLENRYAPIELKIYRDAVPLTATDLQALLIICATTSDLKSGTVSDETWNRAWSHLTRRIKRRLGLYTYKVSEYQPQPDHTPQTRLAIAQVCAEKQVLEKALESIDVLMKTSPKELGYVEFLQPIESEAQANSTVADASSQQTSEVTGDAPVEVSAGA